jgi:hypothetical protein
MFAASLTSVVVYLLVGLLLCLITLRGRSVDWDELLLTWLLGPPLFVLLAALAVIEYVWTRLPPSRSGTPAG